MKLTGDYKFETIRDALQGSFSCYTMNKGDKEYICLELFFLRLCIYPNDRVEVYTLSNDNGKSKLIGKITLQ